MFYSKIICSIILEMQGAWFIQNFSKLLILYPRFENTHRVKRLGEIRDAFQTLNPVKSEVWNIRATVSLKFHFFSPEFRYRPQACAWQGREAHWGNPSSCFVTIHLPLWAHWCYGLADPCCPPPSWNDVICFIYVGLLKRSASEQ